MCVCCDIYIYIRVCEVKIFLPLKKGTIERKTQTRVRFTLSLSPSLFLSGLFRSLSLSKSFAFLSGFEKKRGKKNRIKFLFEKAGIFPRIPPLFVSHVIIITWNYSLFARILAREGWRKGRRQARIKVVIIIIRERERKKEQF